MDKRGTNKKVAKNQTKAVDGLKKGSVIEYLEYRVYLVAFLWALIVFGGIYLLKRLGVEINLFLIVLVVIIGFVVAGLIGLIIGLIKRSKNPKSLLSTLSDRR